MAKTPSKHKSEPDKVGEVFNKVKSADLAAALRLGQIKEALKLRRAGARFNPPGRFTGWRVFFSEKLPNLNSSQVDLDLLLRIVPVQEVINRCGPIYYPGSTMSLGPRPAGWGSAAAEDRILSWTEGGYGLVGDQVVDIHDRYITTKPLTEFLDAIIAGPLDTDRLEELPEDMGAIRWEGKVLPPDVFDVDSFQRLFLQRKIVLKELEWNFDFTANALTGEAIRLFFGSEELESNAQILMACGMARGMTPPDQAKANARMFAAAAKLDASLTRTVEIILLGRRCMIADKPTLRKKALAAVNAFWPQTALETDLVAACKTLLAARDGQKVTLDTIEAWVRSFRDVRSPYASWTLEELCNNLIIIFLEADEDIYNKPHLLRQALRCGFRWRGECQRLALIACEIGNEALLKEILEAGFWPKGRIHESGCCFVGMAKAVDLQNIEAIRLLLHHGADPLEPTHYSGLSSARLAADSARKDSSPSARAVFQEFERLLGKDHPAFADQSSQTGRQ